MISRKTKEKWTERIEYCWIRINKLNDWEADFISGMHYKWGWYKIELSLRESFKLSEIFYKLEVLDI